MKSGVANLLTCLRIEDRETKITRLQAFSEQEWEKILAAASQYGVVPILFHTLNHVHSDLYIPQAIWTQMKHTYYRPEQPGYICYPFKGCPSCRVCL